MPARKWFYGNFRLDCALGNKVEWSLFNEIWVPCSLSDEEYIPLESELLYNVNIYNMN